MGRPAAPRALQGHLGTVQGRRLCRHRGRGRDRGPYPPAGWHTAGGRRRRCLELAYHAGLDPGWLIGQADDVDLATLLEIHETTVTETEKATETATRKG